MPMSIATVNRERSLRTLTRNLFVFAGDDADEQLRRAETALLRANPSLANRDGFSSGVVVRIPADLGLATTARVTIPDLSVSGSLREVRTALQLAVKTAEEAFIVGEKSGKQTLNRLQDDAFQRAIKRDAPKAVRLIEQSREAIAERLDASQENREALSGVLADALEQIERLEKLRR